LKKIFLFLTIILFSISLVTSLCVAENNSVKDIPTISISPEHLSETQQLMDLGLSTMKTDDIFLKLLGLQISCLALKVETEHITEAVVESVNFTDEEADAYLRKWADQE